MNLGNLKIILRNHIQPLGNRPEDEKPIKKLERLPRISKNKTLSPIRRPKKLIDKGKEILLDEIFSKIEITLLVNNFRIDTLALIDQKINSNFIYEELIPINLLQKIKINLASTNNQDPKYKATNILICNNNISLKTSFILARYLTQPIVLGNLFFDLLEPFHINQNGIKTKLLGQDLEFNFVNPHI